MMVREMAVFAPSTTPACVHVLLHSPQPLIGCRIFSLWEAVQCRGILSIISGSLGVPKLRLAVPTASAYLD